MLLIFESYDKSGKSTLSKRLSQDLEIPYVKLNNINIVENESIKDGISISTHSQLETVTQLFEKGVMKDAVLDRFHASEMVYASLFNREYDLSYLENIEERLAKSNDVYLIRTTCNFPQLKNRWKNEKLIDHSYISKLITGYHIFYENTKLNVIEIDTSLDEDISYQFLITELYERGIYKKHLRDKRYTHDEAMISIAKTIARRSPDLSRQVGSVLTEDGFIIGVGYNGPPKGLAHDEYDLRKQKGFKSGEGLEYSRSIHAEQNAIMQAGIRATGKGKLELFCTTSPCIQCTRMLIQIGVSRIVYIDKYNDELAEKMWQEAGIEVVQWSE